MGAGSRLSGNSDSGPQVGALLLVAPGPLPLYRGPLGLESERAAAVCCRGLLLALVATTDRFYRAVVCLPF